MSWMDILTKRLTGELPTDAIIVIDGMVMVKYDKLVIEPGSIRFCLGDTTAATVNVNTGALDAFNIALPSIAYLPIKKG